MVILCVCLCIYTYTSIYNFQVELTRQPVRRGHIVNQTLFPIRRYMHTHSLMHILGPMRCKGNLGLVNSRPFMPSPWTLNSASKIISDSLLCVLVSTCIQSTAWSHVLRKNIPPIQQRLWGLICAQSGMSSSKAPGEEGSGVESMTGRIIVLQG